jgi:hypothetical protein
VSRKEAQNTRALIRGYIPLGNSIQDAGRGFYGTLEAINLRESY